MYDNFILTLFDINFLLHQLNVLIELGFLWHSLVIMYIFLKHILILILFKLLPSMLVFCV